MRVAEKGPRFPASRETTGVDRARQEVLKSQLEKSPPPPAFVGPGFQNKAVEGVCGVVPAHVCSPPSSPGPRRGSPSSKNYNSQQSRPRRRAAAEQRLPGARPGDRASAPGGSRQPAGSRPCRREAPPPAGPGASLHRVSDGCTRGRRALPRDGPTPPPSHPATSRPRPSDSRETVSFIRRAADTSPSDLRDTHLD